MIRHIIDQHDKAIPAILEIPSKDQPYDPSKDSILRRAKVSENLNNYIFLFVSPSLSLTLLFHRVCTMLMISDKHPK